MGVVTDIFKGIPLPKDVADRLAQADKQAHAQQLKMKTLEFQLKKENATLREKDADIKRLNQDPEQYRQSREPSGGSWMSS